jgi:hypothetical protein
VELKIHEILNSNVSCFVSAISNAFEKESKEWPEISKPLIKNLK